MQVSEKNFPIIHHAFDLIGLDNGIGTCEKYAVPDAFNNQLPVIEKQLATMSLDELDTLCSGEDTDQNMVVEKYACLEAHKFLNLFFDGWMVN